MYRRYTKEPSSTRRPIFISQRSCVFGFFPAVAIIFYQENRKLIHEPRKRRLPSLICDLSFQIVLKVRKRVTLMVLTVTAIFAICWCADSILHLLERFYFHENLPLGRAIIHSTLTCNAAVNPFAYALINKSFRVKIKEILSSSSDGSATARPFPLLQKKSNGTNITSALHPAVTASDW